MLLSAMANAAVRDVHATHGEGEPGREGERERQACAQHQRAAERAGEHGDDRGGRPQAALPVPPARVESAARPVISVSTVVEVGDGQAADGGVANAHACGHERDRHVAGDGRRVRVAPPRRRWSRMRAGPPRDRGRRRCEPDGAQRDGGPDAAGAGSENKRGHRDDRCDDRESAVRASDPEAEQDDAAVVMFAVNTWPRPEVAASASTVPVENVRRAEQATGDGAGSRLPARRGTGVHGGGASRIGEFLSSRSLARALPCSRTARRHCGIEMAF